ncbi:hypothetical protein Taro_038467 [Colocasia esculenta]|uniref:VQ domain-containing protein n=1 Tax=Colocasia esculenta TaxID=4460 RepID=A0A843W3K0_COLES|nr:hypothetical protein [Colocasia esculenta]
MDFSTDSKPSPRREVQLQGPRPTPLKVSKDSHKIRKPPVAPAQQHHPPPPQQQPPRAPVIIYTVSPRVIHTEPGDFMTLVQRLTGPSPTGAAGPAAPLGSLSPGPAGPLSPAARFAAIERGCPPPNPHKPPPHAIVEDMADLVGFSAALDMGNLPGILSPFPSALPGISPSYFSSPPSAGDLGSLTFLNEMSPVFRGGNRGFVDGPFLPSPNNLLFTPTLPSPGALWDILGQL